MPERTAQTGQRLDLTQGPLVHTLIRLALPIAASMVLRALYSLVDAFWPDRISSRGSSWRRQRSWPMRMGKRRFFMKRRISSTSRRWHSPGEASILPLSWRSSTAEGQPPAAAQLLFQKASNHEHPATSIHR